MTIKTFLWTVVSWLGEVSFSANERKRILKESGLMLLAKLLGCGWDFWVTLLNSSPDCWSISIVSDKFIKIFLFFFLLYWLELTFCFPAFYIGWIVFHTSLCHGRPWLESCLELTMVEVSGVIPFTFLEVYAHWQLVKMPHTRRLKLHWGHYS